MHPTAIDVVPEKRRDELVKVQHDSRESTLSLVITLLLFNFPDAVTSLHCSRPHISLHNITMSKELRRGSLPVIKGKLCLVHDEKLVIS